MFLRNTSIKQKLSWITMLTTGVALVVATVAFAVYDTLVFRNEMVRHLTILAEVVGGNSASAIVFNDQNSAEATLGALKAQRNITTGCIHDATGKVLATYFRDKKSKGVCPDEIPLEGYVFQTGSLVVFQHILLDGETIGTVHIVSDLEELNTRQGRFALIVILILFGSTLVAFLMSLGLQRTITRPILELVALARNVSTEKDYAVRAKKYSEDEIGHLIDGFNEMLETIQERDTQLTAAKLKAEGASETKSAFLANMSHELRTPLNAIIGYGELLQEEAQEVGQEEFIPDLLKITAAGKHLLALINDILDLSKIEAGRMELYLETIDIRATVEDVVATVQPLLEKNVNRLTVNCSDSIGTMRADLIKLRQILFNLLSNASKFAKEGSITVDIVKEQVEGADWVSFAVADSGIGMTPEQMGKLFEAFSQADTSTTREFGGTGLGLAISRKMSEMMGGEINVKSEHGKGSTFTVHLPVEVELPEGQEDLQIDRSAEVSVDSGSGTVLVIDDDPRVREILARFLAREGFAVATASTGKEGLLLARELRPTAVTLDVLMPNMDGWEVLAEIKADPELADIPVIMLTILDDKSKGYALGASDYLTKPIDRIRLAAVLEKYRSESPPYHVLIVEDEKMSRDEMVSCLEQEGWTISAAENGRVALELMADSKPTVIVLDLMMPEMDGFQFVDELQAREEWSTIPIVVVTAKDLTRKEHKHLNRQAIQILQKGEYSQEELLNYVRDVLVAHTAVRAIPKEEGNNV